MPRGTFQLGILSPKLPRGTPLESWVSPERLEALLELPLATFSCLIMAPRRPPAVSAVLICELAAPRRPHAFSEVFICSILVISAVLTVGRGSDRFI